MSLVVDGNAVTDIVRDDKITNGKFGISFEGPPAEAEAHRDAFVASLRAVKAGKLTSLK